MHSRVLIVCALLVVTAAALPVQAVVSRQQADTFSRKLAQIRERAARPAAPAARTPVSQDELNSWFAFNAPPMLPDGVSRPQFTIIGQGKFVGEATVDLDAVAKRRGTGGTFDPWSYLGGKVPVTVTGVLHTRNGRGRFELESAELSGVPVPKPIFQELVSQYSRSDRHPDGVDLDAPFPLPAGINAIEVGQGQAVIVQ